MRWYNRKFNDKLLQTCNIKIQKKFNQWRTKYLLFSFAGLPIVSIYLTRWILGNHFTREDFCEVWCEKFKTMINTKDMLTYLTSKTNPLTIIQQHTNLFPTHKPALKEIADGICVWDTNVSIEVLAFCQFVKQK